MVPRRTTKDTYGSIYYGREKPAEITAVLGSKGINSWDGDFYAVEAIQALGLEEKGGLVRLGIAPYCTESDIDRTLNTVNEIAADL